jgi:three-Cys-motif partner protein
MADPVLWPLDDHTRAKHRVLAAYLAAWLAVMGQQAKKFKGRNDPPRLLVVDGFAGPGRYETGEDGSPLIMLKTLLEHDAFERLGEVEFLFLFIEHDGRRVEHLQRELDDLDAPDNVKVMLEHGEFEDTFGEMVDDVHGKDGITLVPTFAFIDPFGYSFTPMSLAGKFLDFERCEALFFLPMVDIVRFVSREGQKNAMNSLFGTERWQEAIALALRPSAGSRDRVSPLSQLTIESLHRGDHSHHQQRDEQDQAHVLDRPLTALAAGEPQDRLRTPHDRGVCIAHQRVEHQAPFVGLGPCSAAACRRSRRRCAD